MLVVARAVVVAVIVTIIVAIVVAVIAIVVCCAENSFGRTFFTCFAAYKTAGDCTEARRIEFACGECHVLEYGARIGSGVGKNIAFTVGDAVFSTFYENRNGSFDADKCE